MYEDQTYENILARSLSKVATNVDKREGSLVMNAIAPTSAEHANIYILLDSILRNGYVDTADIREYVVYRCRERGINPYKATHAVLKGKFNMKIPIGSRFNCDTLNYITKDVIEVTDEGYYYYQMECETTGEIGNTAFGELSPIEYIDKDLEGELVELLIPAEDEESLESLRARYLNSFDSNPFGGNKQDYQVKTNALDGVGGTIPIPVWNGGGTVKLIIIDSEYNVASPILVSSVQAQIDPTPQGTGSGIAPIGHTVTVVSAVEKPIEVSCKFILNEGYRWEHIKDSVVEAIEAYMLELRKGWEKAEGTLVVRIAQIETRLIALEGVIDVADTKINGVDSNLSLAIEELPVLGGVTSG